MAWGIVIKKSDASRRRRVTTSRPRSLLWSPIARLILASNLAGLVILIVGALVLNEVRSNLVQARKESLQETGALISSVLTEVATRGEPEPRLINPAARAFLKRIEFSPSTRIRILDADKSVVADTYLLNDEIEGRELPPIRKPGALAVSWLNIIRTLNATLEGVSPRGQPTIAEARTLEEEAMLALQGEVVASERFNDRGERIISVSAPIRLVGAVVGALTLETSDIAGIIAAERAALLPFIIVAVMVAVITSTLLTAVIARPLRKLSLASDRVRTGAAERLNLGSLSGRRDEIGDLAKAMEAMTETLHDRIQANERFAADVAHELKNPLTSIRSAVETSQAVSDPAVRERMHEVIARDVVRLDRLITDISNLSRLEAEIVREKRVRVDLGRLLDDIVSIYRDTARPGDARILLDLSGAEGQTNVMGREGPLSQVVRNLVENARSFSPPSGEVKVALRQAGGPNGPMLRLTVEDEGPGVPPDKLEKIFERFYSDRPRGAKFGNNSGLGLSIVRQIVETHRGRVWAENRPEGKGARFVVDLPAARDG
ncbi:MAG: sensor N-terminal transmembrane domain-containing protein [Alphaproteobacteria bacterium]|nr:sensor N-terminal transmembrane domain-containing protein [Alphaproteobacteria bacterium]